MATTYKRLGATTVGASTTVSLYQVPATTVAVVSSILACNQGSNSATFRIAHTAGAATSVTAAEYMYYDVPISANDTFIATVGATMATGQSIMVYSSSTGVNFMAWGSEIS